MKSSNMTTNPENHITTFLWIVIIVTLDPKLLCILFSMTLMGSFRFWFNNLPMDSIKYFDALYKKNKFMMQI